MGRRKGRKKLITVQKVYTSVSYTHLDVYKRQSRHKADKVDGKVFCLECAPVRDSRGDTVTGLRDVDLQNVRVTNEEVLGRVGEKMISSGAVREIG